MEIIRRIVERDDPVDLIVLGGIVVPYMGSVLILSETDDSLRVELTELFEAFSCRPMQTSDDTNGCEDLKGRVEKKLLPSILFGCGTLAAMAFIRAMPFLLRLRQFL